MNRFFNSLFHRHPKQRLQCPVCGKNVRAFNRIGDWAFEGAEKHMFPHSPFCFEMPYLFKYSCPSCGSANRNRLYALYLKKQFDSLPADKTVNLLDITPAPQLTKFIKQYSKIKYRSCDLFTDFADDKVDIQDMSIYGDASFDILLCSHVLEHVPDDVKAMRELYRVLKKGGWGIVMVPIMMTIKDICEDPSVTDEAQRWKLFGQGDHVRLYSKTGFVARLEKVGFKVHLYGVDYFGAEDFLRYGIPDRSVLYVVEK